MHAMATEERTQEIIVRIADAVVRFEEEQCASWCRTAVDEGVNAQRAIVEGLAGGMERVSELYSRKEYFVPELLLCADALYAGLAILRPHVRIEAGQKGKTIILGVMLGDVHDIGKNLVKAMFVAAGWEVIDLGRDVSPDLFEAELRRTGADAVGLSSLMTSSMLAMPKLIARLRAVAPEVKIIVGGAPVTPELARRFEADGYAPDAVRAVAEADRLLRAAR